MSWRKKGGNEEMDAHPPKLGQGEVKIKSIRHHQNSALIAPKKVIHIVLPA